MKSDEQFSNLDQRKYIGLVLAAAGIAAAIAAAVVAWPGLSHVLGKIF